MLTPSRDVVLAMDVLVSLVARVVLARVMGETDLYDSVLESAGSEARLDTGDPKGDCSGLFRCADDVRGGAGETDLLDSVLEKAAGAGSMACRMEAESVDTKMLSSCLCGRSWGPGSGDGLVTGAVGSGNVRSCLCGHLWNIDSWTGCAKG